MADSISEGAPGRKAGSRRVNPMEPGWPGQRTGFFDQQSEWGKYKHQILRKYLRGWVYKLGKAYPELAFIDGCAGEGAYGDGSPGSPLIAVKWNDEQVTSGRGGRLVVHAVEADQESAARLRGVLRPWLDRVPPQAIVYVESLEVRLPLLLERTREVPTLVFIDPYGLGPLSKDKLEPLLRDRNRAPTEILVRADPVLLARWAGWADERPRDARGARTAQSFRDKLKGYNINPEVVGGQFNKGLRPTVFDLFNAYLTIFQDRFQYVQLIPIRPSYYAAPKYFLVHGTDSPHGAALINDTVSTTEDQLFTRTQISEAGGQGFLFQPERNLRVGLEDAETAILTFLTGSRGKRWIEVRAELAMRFGPDLREKYHRTALRGLLERGLVTNLRAEKLTDKSLLSISPKDI